MPIPPPMNTCVCARWAADASQPWRKPGTADVFCVRLFDDEWEWLEAAAAYATEFDERNRLFEPYEILAGELRAAMERSSPDWREWTREMRRMVDDSKKARMERGESRFADGLIATRHGEVIRAQEQE